MRVHKRDVAQVRGDRKASELAWPGPARPGAGMITGRFIQSLRVRNVIYQWSHPLIQWQALRGRLPPGLSEQKMVHPRKGGVSVRCRARHRAQGDYCILQFTTRGAPVYYRPSSVERLMARHVLIGGRPRETGQRSESGGIEGESLYQHFAESHGVRARGGAVRTGGRGRPGECS
jgi:hypothetical protein